MTTRDPRDEQPHPEPAPAAPPREPDTAPPPPPSVSFDEIAPPRLPPPERVRADAFFEAPAPAPEGPPALEAIPRNPMRLGRILAGVGFLGSLVFAAGFLHQVVIGAPVFEEMLKFGLALMLVAWWRIGAPAPRLVLAMFPGAAFGVLEHYVTYADEPLSYFADRVLFHSGATALSMAAYSAIEPLWDARIRWASVVPAIIIHWANNFLAVVLGVGSILAGDAAEGLALAVGFTLAATAHGLAWGIVLAAPAIRHRAAREWMRRAPPPVTSPADPSGVGPDAATPAPARAEAPVAEPPATDTAGSEAGRAEDSSAADRP